MSNSNYGCENNVRNLRGILINTSRLKGFGYFFSSQIIIFRKPNIC